MRRYRRHRTPIAGMLLLLAAAIVLAACGGATQPVEEAAAPAGSEEAAAEDDYQAQRAECTWEAPCWPEIVDTVPSSFGEAPMLAELVEAGELPPVEERLPVEPLVIQPAEMIGEYGGTWHRAFTGPGDRQNLERMNNDYAIFWDASATELRPRIVKEWEANEDATEWTYHLREGMKWSDGAPYTADDYLFWYEHIFLNDQLVPSELWWMVWGGEPAVFEKVDDLTFKITFAQPFPTWAETMATSTVAGHFHKGVTGGGLVAPRHYLEQFHPDFVGEEEANRLAEEAGFEAWHLHFLAKNDAHMNTELPVTTPWKAVTTVASSEYILERNPYFFAVDTEGNQLPYFDRVSKELVEELEVLNLRAMAGNYTLQGRHIAFSNLPVIRESQDEGDYFVDFWTSRTRHQIQIAFNQDWQGDEEILAYTRDSLEFRKALSLAIERSEINETYFLGVGNETSFCPADTPPFFNSDRWDEEFGRFDPEEANAILDSIGLDQRDNEGYRLLPSGERLVLRADAVSGAFLDFPSIGQRIARMWKDNVGIQLLITPVERSLHIERATSNQHMMLIFVTGAWTPNVSPTLLPDIRWAPVATQWAETPNPDPADYDGPQWIKDLVLKHWEAVQELDPEKRMQLYIEGTELMCDNHARLGMVTNVPDHTVIIKNNVRNVPIPLERNVYAQTPSHAYPETWSVIGE